MILSFIVVVSLLKKFLEYKLVPRQNNETLIQTALNNRMEGETYLPRVHCHVHQSQPVTKKSRGQTLTFIYL